ncbi:MAG TPA: hypothetical protein PKE03_04595 [Bacteroidales bacterium]|nr:hypothetical protein [Bacteroidales bacterium]
MKRFTAIFILLVTAQMLTAQITINNLDFANANDTVRTSMSANVLGFDFASTGPNYTWNYAGLSFETQRLDTFYTITQAPPIFLLTFLSVANLATKLGMQQFLPGIQIGDAWQFFNKGLTNYRDWGYGFIITDIPLPLRFTTPDLLYNFPLSYNQNYSSNASLEYPLSGVGYISIARNRQNHVDGWGSLTTPFGTFQTLRVKSTVRESDSIYIDSIGQGIRINRSYIEYKWLAKNQKIPLLVATVDSILGTFVVYKDSLRTQTVGFPEYYSGRQRTYPQPFHDKLYFHYCKSSPGNLRLNLYNADGRLIHTSFEQAPQGCSDRLYNWPAVLKDMEGLFFLMVSDGTDLQTFKLIRSRQ